MVFHLKIKNYRGIRSLDFNPEGVCLLVGPNGSGKSTLLSVIKLLRTTFERGFDTPPPITNSDMAGEPTIFEIETPDLLWELKVLNSLFITEKVTQAGFAGIGQLKTIYDAIRFEGSVRLGSDSPLNENPRIDHEKIENFVRILTGYQYYHDYNTWRLREAGSLAGSETELYNRGQNAFSVLRNWHTSRPLRERYEFVISTLREAFPLFFEDLDFESAGQTVTIRIYPPGSDTQPIPVYFAANGLLTAMLNLMAVCSAPDGGIVSIDEPENGLHPYAIKVLIDAFRDHAADRNLTVLLATHSRFVLNQFRYEPHRVYLMDQNEAEQLVRLDKIRNPEWLRCFSLGDLYGNDFARQEESSEIGGAE